jgi:SAM-dependent methyltransferase
VRLLTRPVSPGRGRVGMRLHLGCFDRPLDGWVNTDVTPHIWIARLPGLPALLHRVGRLTPERLAQHRDGVFRQVMFLDASRPFPFADGTVAAIFCSHLLEHLAYEDALRCLREAHRVLQPGGVVRIAVPDLDRMVAEYRPEEADAWVMATFEARQSRDAHRHKWMYNERTLAIALRSAGFATVERCRPREGRCPDVGVLDNRYESLFMEAVR